MTHNNPFFCTDEQSSRRLNRLSMAFDRAGGRLAALQLLGLDRRTIADISATARELQARYGTPERAMARLAACLAMDAALVEQPNSSIPTMRGGNGHAGKLSPEDALKALASRDDGLLEAESSVELERDPRLNAIRAQMSDEDFQALLRMIASVRDDYATPTSHAEDHLTFDTGAYQIASPTDRARYLAFKREIAKIRERAPMATDAAAREQSFKEMFPGATIPERILHHDHV